MHILVVEDRKDSSTALSRILEREGYVITRASTLAEARSRCAKRRFALMLCDISMPDGDGWRFMKELCDACLDIPAIAVTGHASPDDKRRSFEAGFAAHVTKPVDVDGLLKVVRWVLSQRDPESGSWESAHL